MDALALQLKEEVDRALADAEAQKKAVLAEREALEAEKASQFLQSRLSCRIQVRRCLSPKEMVKLP